MPTLAIIILVLPAALECIVPGFANLRLSRFLGPDELSRREPLELFLQYASEFVLVQEDVLGKVRHFSGA
jgi:hypothetical protein